ncbi:MAG: hypothetical protein J0M02_17650 [Planctomycetes bacterium]|nr:hypothetical protein [Planctomycetota bacterium]
MSTPVADEAALEGALRDLLQAFSATSDGWRDGARDEFDRDHLREIDARTRQAMKALAELSALCADAVRRCE